MCCVPTTKTVSGMVDSLGDQVSPSPSAKLTGCGSPSTKQASKSPRSWFRSLDDFVPKAEFFKGILIETNEFGVYLSGFIQPWLR